MPENSVDKTAQQKWMAVLAKADWPTLEKLWKDQRNNYQFQTIRKPETGLVMVRGRAGGSGAPFNLGEATVTRCTVQSSAGNKGNAYVLGRNHTHALVAAELDAALQDETRNGSLLEEIIEPLARMAASKKQHHREKVATTKVDFFTMVRGED